MGLGRAYAQLKPTAPNAADAPLNFFLDTLYQAQGADYRVEGSDQLRQFLQGFGQPEQKVNLMELAKNMLLALKQVKDPALQSQQRDPGFIQEYLQLGRSYASLDPQESDPQLKLKFFLDTLYGSPTPLDIRNGAKELETFLQDFTTAQERLQLLEFERKQLIALKLVSSFRAAIRQPEYIDGV
jgi:hypothetical protein